MTTITIDNLVALALRGWERDNRLCVLWTCIVGICLGFWLGVFTLAAALV